MGDAWEFWIDVGGTFTDCVAKSPAGLLSVHKVLSNGATKGTIDEADGDGFVDSARTESQHFWTGYDCTAFLADGTTQSLGTIHNFRDGRFLLKRPPRGLIAGLRYELAFPEPAPIFAIRTAMGLRLDDALPRAIVKLGTTRGTNALLTRRGAKTALVTNVGFGDVLKIGNQDRPHLFDLNVRRPEPLFTETLEIAGRLDATGSEIEAVDGAEVAAGLLKLKSAGIEAVAVVLMNSYRNPVHEEAVAQIARHIGFRSVTTSSGTARRIKFIPRGDTATLDAYLNPVLVDYIGSVEKRLAAGSTLRLMSSSGGLLSAGHFTGKDSVLSGPAGGVAALSRIPKQTGLPRVIGFDMGGTSTDVSRFEDRLEMQFEAVKAGVRLATPTLAIETVAAGGGSVCGFDGVKLTVGPDSAGADPGPACYGRGGPLTVTDINLLLGRIPADYFPFPLDQVAVTARLHLLIDEIAASPFGRVYAPTDLAEGFRAIAIEAMSKAIRTVSLRRGYDAAEHALVTFGGAGGQHVCALADSLGMSIAISPPHAGVFSAYGIGTAAVRKIAERPLLIPLNAAARQPIEDAAGELQRELNSAIAGEVTGSSALTQRLWLDLRYRGTETTLPIVWQGETSAAADQFSVEHHRLYGYDHAGRAIEAVAIRGELIAGSVAEVEAPVATAERSAEPIGQTRMWLSGVAHAVPLYDRSQLPPGCSVGGPAIILESAATLVVDPGWTGEMLSNGQLVLRRTTAEPSAEQAPASASDVQDDCRQKNETQAAFADPIQLELFNNRFAGIAEQMGEVLRQTSVSTNVKERLDYSCALFDAVGNLVVNAPHIPVHLGAMGETVRHVLSALTFAPGDVILTNDPYRGGSHLPDVTAVTPVFDSSGTRLLFVTASRAHHAEIGGIVPGSMPPFSTNLAEEGVLLRAFRVVTAGQFDEAGLRERLTAGPYPSRCPDDNVADVAAQIAANERGATLLRDLIARHSLPTVLAYMEHIRQAAAEKVRLALGKFEPNTYRFVDHLDDGSPIAAAITIHADSSARTRLATVDFSGTGGVLGTNLNANRGIVRAAVLYVFRCLIAEEVPLNDGVLDPVEIILPECLLNPPANDDLAKCPAVVGGNVETSQRVVDVLLGALKLAAASQGTMNNLTFGNASFGYYETICGGTGATRDASGCDGVHSHMTNTRLTDPEVLESRYPVRLRRFAIRRQSGGNGQHRGGDGVIRELEFLAPLSVSMLSERRGDSPPFGLAGGEPGETGRNTLQNLDGTTEDLGGKFRRDFTAGERLRIETPGGGGFGEA